jgi:hypothetical protein
VSSASNKKQKAGSAIDGSVQTRKQHKINATASVSIFVDAPNMTPLRRLKPK